MTTLGCLFGVLFIALKLTGVIMWAWVWVLAPIWGAVIFDAAFVVVVLLLFRSKARTFVGLG